MDRVVEASRQRAETVHSRAVHSRARAESGARSAKQAMWNVIRIAEDGHGESGYTPTHTDDRMTEYDYSEEALTAYLATQDRISRWADTTHRVPQADPETPRTPALSEAALPRREMRDSRSSRKRAKSSGGDGSRGRSSGSRRHREVTPPPPLPAPPRGIKLGRSHSGGPPPRPRTAPPPKDTAVYIPAQHAIYAAPRHPQAHYQPPPLYNGSPPSPPHPHGHHPIPIPIKHRRSNSLPQPPMQPHFDPLFDPLQPTSYSFSVPPGFGPVARPGTNGMPVRDYEYEYERERERPSPPVRTNSNPMPYNGHGHGHGHPHAQRPMYAATPAPPPLRVPPPQTRPSAQPLGYPTASMSAPHLHLAPHPHASPPPPGPSRLGPGSGNVLNGGRNASSSRRLAAGPAPMPMPMPMKEPSWLKRQRSEKLPNLNLLDSGSNMITQTVIRRMSDGQRRVFAGGPGCEALRQRETLGHSLDELASELSFSTVGSVRAPSSGPLPQPRSRPLGPERERNFKSRHVGSYGGQGFQIHLGSFNVEQRSPVNPSRRRIKVTASIQIVRVEIYEAKDFELAVSVHDGDAVLDAGELFEADVLVVPKVHFEEKRLRSNERVTRRSRVVSDKGHSFHAPQRSVCDDGAPQRRCPHRYMHPPSPGERKGRIYLCGKATRETWRRVHPCRIVVADRVVAWRADVIATTKVTAFGTCAECCRVAKRGYAVPVHIKFGRHWDQYRRLITGLFSVKFLHYSPSHKFTKKKPVFCPNPRGECVHQDLGSKVPHAEISTVRNPLDSEISVSKAVHALIGSNDGPGSGATGLPIITQAVLNLSLIHLVKDEGSF
ncbi:hypothetical protein C8F01DRAFT_1076846 [Mycena amicta]|nr:hypothetical protein C8F01DRAFT_1076846 [Mycena amicta]